MGFRQRDDVFDVGLSPAGEEAAGVGAVDAPAHGGNDPGFDGLTIGVVSTAVGRATVLGRDYEAGGGRLLYV